ncbi:dihydrolipoamide acetyltransferase family protein, partial [Pannus brasiliensis CCIBt3594]
APEPVAPAPVPVAASAPTAKANGRLVASPRAKKLAKELKVDLTTLVGSGPHGRITAEDVERATGKVTAPPAPVVTPAATPAPAKPAAPAPAPASVPVGQTVPLTTLQKAVVQNMMVSLQVPTFHVGYTITTDGLDKLYQQLKSKGVTMTALLAKAIANTLAKHPIVNASYTDAGIQYHGSINVAVAVAMPDGGLITPVLRNADKTDIYSLSRNWKDLVDRSRAKQLQPEEYNSGTFTVSNLGMFGVDRFDAILPPGQGAILAVGASRPQVAVTPEGLFGIQRQMSVNITCDHRVIYGADAAAFLQDLAKLIETDVQSLTL